MAREKFSVQESSNFLPLCQTLQVRFIMMMMTTARTTTMMMTMTSRPKIHVDSLFWLIVHKLLIIFIILLVGSTRLHLSVTHPHSAILTSSLESSCHWTWVGIHRIPLRCTKNWAAQHIALHTWHYSLLEVGGNSIGQVLPKSQLILLFTKNSQGSLIKFSYTVILCHVEHTWAFWISNVWITDWKIPCLEKCTF